MTTARNLFFALCATSAAASAFVIACASDETTTDAKDDASILAPVSDAAIDGDGAAADDDAGPCTDCEWFPADCTTDAFCPNGPFQGTDPSGKLDWRAQITSIRGRSATDVWAVGSLGSIAHFDGTSWSPSNSGRLDTLRVMWLREGSEVTFGAADVIVTRGLPVEDGGSAQGDGWTTRTATCPATYQTVGTIVSSAWAPPGSDDLYFTVTSPVADRKSGLWRLALSSSGDFQVKDVFDQVKKSVFGLCNSVPCSQLTSLYGVSRSELWTVALSGAALHITQADGIDPIVDVYNTQTWDALYGVWGASSSDVWAVGARGTIRHYGGSGPIWDIVEGVPTNQNLNAIWGSSSSDMWAVGDAGVVLHYDGTTWSRIKVAGLGKKRPTLTTVWMPSPGHVWIGGEGVVLSLGGTP